MSENFTVRALRSFVWMCLCYGLLWQNVSTDVAAQNVGKTVRRPNIIFILADDLGYGDVGVYGQKFFRTPYLDRMAREGVRFTQVYAAAPVCAPSRASLMTGLHQGHAYIRGNNDINNQRVPLRPEDVTVGEVLQRAGYRTGVIGKWGLGEPGTTGVPNRKGFDYFFGYLNQTHAHNYYPDYLWRNETRIDLPAGTYSHDLFTQEALDFIRRESVRLDGNDNSRNTKDPQRAPFFLYLAYTLPHANNELGRKTGNGMEVPSDAPYSNENWAQQQKNYAAMVGRMDTDIGKIFALLKALNLDDDTLVFFTSDNGAQGRDEGGFDPQFFNSSGGLRGIKRDLYEGGIREPMIVRWRNAIRAGQTSAHPWSLYDFLPTAADLAGVKPPRKIDGISQTPALLGRENTMRARPFFYWEFHEGGYVQAVRAGRWKLIRRAQNNTVELYDLQADERETRDVAKQRPQITRRLLAILQREHVESAHWPAADGATDK